MTETPNSQLLTCTFPNPASYATLIAQDPTAVIDQAHAIGGGLLLVVYARDVGHELWLFREDGTLVRRVKDEEVLKGGVVRGFVRGREAGEFSLECELTHPSASGLILVSLKHRPSSGGALLFFPLT